MQLSIKVYRMSAMEDSLVARGARQEAIRQPIMQLLAPHKGSCIVHGA